MFRPVPLLTALTLAMTLAGCGDGDHVAREFGPTPPTIALVDAESEILAVDNVFDPEDAVVEAGTTITFVNAGRNDHNVLAAAGSADWEVPTEEFGPTDTASRRFTEPGEYRYYCSIHGTADVGMIGTITVTAPGG